MIGTNGAARGVEDAVHGARDIGIDGRILKREGGIDEFTVLQRQVVDIAEALQALDRAVDERQMLRVPPEVLPGDIGVVHRDVFAVPERVLGEEF